MRTHPLPVHHLAKITTSTTPLPQNHLNEVNGQYLDDLRTMLRRDRNHPSVVIWSLCNEALCQQFDVPRATQLRPIVKALDATRPVSAAMNMGYYDNSFPQLLDLMGFNYNIPM